MYVFSAGHRRQRTRRGPEASIGSIVQEFLSSITVMVTLNVATIAHYINITKITGFYVLG